VILVIVSVIHSLFAHKFCQISALRVDFLNGKLRLSAPPPGLYPGGAMTDNPDNDTTIPPHHRVPTARGGEGIGGSSLFLDHQSCFHRDEPGGDANNCNLSLLKVRPKGANSRKTLKAANDRRTPKTLKYERHNPVYVNQLCPLK